MTRRAWHAHADMTWTRVYAAGGQHWLPAIALMFVMLLAGCGPSAGAQVTQTPSANKPTTSPSVLSTPSPTATPGPTPVVISDLGAFRKQFVAAFTSGQWARVQPMLSADFNFQSPSSVPHTYDAQQRLQTSLQNGKPWSQDDNAVGSHSCYAGSTPLAQIVGFDGNNGHFLMVGIAHASGQSYWVATWAFEDPQGPWDGCISGE
jgi:hypothetical protein